jgi:aspartate aminotransferase
MTKISSRLAAIEPSATFAVFDRVQMLRAQGVTVLDLSGGEPEFATPAPICEAARGAIADGWTHYSPSRGLPALREAIARKLEADNDLKVDPATDVIVTPSAKHALFIALSAVAGPGDEVLIPTPSWVSYKAMAQLAGATPVELPLSGADAFRIREAALRERITPRTRAIVVNSPNNPTGHMLDAHEVALLARVASEHELILVSDEIYEKVVFGERPHLSVGAHPDARDRTLTINGFSKAYAMTGWRLGWLSGPRDLVEAALTVHQHTVGCTSAFVQQGGVAALATPDPVLQEMVSHYRTRRDLVVDGLAGVLGLKCLRPDGAFYAFVNVAGLGRGTGAEVADWLLRTTGVVVTGGEGFGAGGHDYIRLAFAGATAVVEQAVARIRDAALNGESAALAS